MYPVAFSTTLPAAAASPAAAARTRNVSTSGAAFSLLKTSRPSPRRRNRITPPAIQRDAQLEGGRGGLRLRSIRRPPRSDGGRVTMNWIARRELDRAEGGQKGL